MDLLVTDGNSQEETYYDEKSNSNKEDKICWSFETEPTRESGKRSWEDGHAQETIGNKSQAMELLMEMVFFLRAMAMMIKSVILAIAISS